MKRFPVLHISFCIVVIALAGRFAAAQQLPGFSPGETAVITLKSGDKFEGKVLRDLPDSVEIEYRPTPKIKDQKILLKSDIASVLKQSPAQVEFAERALGKILPTADLKEASWYESTIQDKLRTFAAKYPGTPEAAEVEKIIITLSEEKSKVLSGQVKMEGRWLDPATVNREAYNIQAYAIYLQMKDRAAENREMHYLEALRSFEKLRIERPISPYFIKAIPDALEYLKKYEAQLGGMIKEAPLLIKKREEGLKQLSSNELPPAKKAIDEEKRHYDETLRHEMGEKPPQKWLSIYKYEDKADRGVMGKALGVIAKERAELTSLDIDQLKVDAEALMTVIRDLADKKIAEAKAAMDRAKKIPSKFYWPQIRPLEEQVKVATLQAQKDIKQGGATVATGEAAAKEGEKSGGNTVKDLLKKAEAEKKRKAEEAERAAAAKAAAEANAEPAPPPPPPTLMEKLNDYLPVIGGGLVVVILLAWLVGKRKRGREDDDA